MCLVQRKRLYIGNSHSFYRYTYFPECKGFCYCKILAVTSLSSQKFYRGCPIVFLFQCSWSDTNSSLLKKRFTTSSFSLIVLFVFCWISAGQFFNQLPADDPYILISSLIFLSFKTIESANTNPEYDLSRRPRVKVIRVVLRQVFDKWNFMFC